MRPDAEMRAYLENLFETNHGYCRGEWCRTRNEVLLGWVAGERFNRVVELAGASGLFAGQFLDEHDEVSEYLHTDYINAAVALALRRNKGRLAFRSVNRDAREPVSELAGADLIVCTGCEHLPEGIEQRLFEQSRPGTVALFGMSNFWVEDGGHINICKSEAEARARIAPFGEVQEIELFRDLQWLVKAIRCS